MRKYTNIYRALTYFSKAFKTFCESFVSLNTKVLKCYFHCSKVLAFFFFVFWGINFKLLFLVLIPMIFVYNFVTLIIVMIRKHFSVFCFVCTLSVFYTV